MRIGQIDIMSLLPLKGVLQFLIQQGSLIRANNCVVISFMRDHRNIKMDWTKVGQKYVKDKENALKAINKLSWQTTKGLKSLSMMQGMAINQVIKNYRIPHVSDIAIDG